MQGELERLHGVMVGREAYHNPWWLASWDEAFFGEPASQATRDAVEERLVGYMVEQARSHGTGWGRLNDFSPLMQVP